MKKLKKNKILILTFILIIVFSVIIGIFISNKSTTIKEKVPEHLMVENGYYLNLYTDEKKGGTGIIEYKNSDNILYADVENIGNNRSFIIKLYLDYKEINFFVDEKEYSTYYFSLDSSKRKTIPIKLSNINTSINHKLTISLIEAPEKYTSDVEGPVTSSYGITLDYFLQCTDNEELKNDNTKYEEPLKTFKEGFNGFVINDDLSKSNETKYPSKLIKAKKNEKVKLAYRIGSGFNESEFLIVLDVGWKQVNIDNEPFKLIKREKDKPVYGELSFIAPSKPGKYEITAILIENPFKINKFEPINKSFRFTLEVS